MKQRLAQRILAAASTREIVEELQRRQHSMLKTLAGEAANAIAKPVARRAKERPTQQNHPSNRPKGRKPTGLP